MAPGRDRVTSPFASYAASPEHAGFELRNVGILDPSPQRRSYQSCNRYQAATKGTNQGLPE